MYNLLWKSCFSDSFKQLFRRLKFPKKAIWGIKRILIQNSIIKHPKKAVKQNRLANFFFKRIKNKFCAFQGVALAAR